MNAVTVCDHAVRIRADDGCLLEGTECRPEGGGPFPAALLLNGSGPLDRDANMKGQRLEVSSTLAEALAAVGLASLRFDKRGVGRSEGDFPTTSFEGETADAAAALAALRARPGIDADRVGGIGHSVGATIAVRLAAAEPMAFAVLLACPASTGAATMQWQTARIADSLPGPRWLLGRWFERRQHRAFDRLSNSTTDTVRLGRQDAPARWLRQFRAYDPLPDLARVRCPVLAITGGKDIQVDVNELDDIAREVAGDCTIHAPDDLTHVLRCSPGPPRLRDYQRLISHPVDPSLLDTVSTWVAGAAR